MTEGVNYQRALEAIRLKVQVDNHLKNDISIFAISIRHSKSPKLALQMIADQYKDNPKAMYTMFGANLINSILQYFEPCQP